MTSPYYPFNADEIAKRFTYHPPIGNQAERYESIRQNAKALAEHLSNCCPPSRELSLALTHLEDSVMWANAAIARNEKLNEPSIKA